VNPQRTAGEFQGALRARWLVNRKRGHHARLHMIGDLTMKKPRSRIIRRHIHLGSARGQQLNDVQVSVAVRHCFAMPMWSMKILLIPHAHQIPAHFLALPHRQTRQVSENIPINGVK
jgi:hypothetical protein